jgi:DNA-binding LacI/PurR family transcriptional regulator
MTDGPVRANGRPPSMADVAAAAGVSHQTVSRVLNGSPLVKENTREKVLSAIAALGYRRNLAARVLATNRSGQIGMISAHLALYGPSRIAMAVQDAGHEAGYEVALVGVDDFGADSLRGAVDRLLDQAVEALVVAVAHGSSLERALSLEIPIPLVTAQGVTSGQAMAAGVDQVAGGVLATEHLLGLGHSRVAHVTGPLDWVEAGQRRTGWQLAHERAHLLPGPELAGDWTARSGYEAGRRLAADPSVSAVFAANDDMALGVLKALHESGRGTTDVSVVGFDNTPDSAYFWPSLTSVTQDFDALGRCAVDLVLRALAGEESAAAGLIAPTLVVRDSTRPPA